jgi:WhiB family redox-sensing transcriptional regulator
MSRPAFGLPEEERSPQAAPRIELAWKKRFCHDAWQAQALCAGMGPDLFFPVGERAEQSVQEIQAAKAVCAVCPVKLHCLVFALGTNEEDGVWGGYTPSERRALKRIRKRRRKRKP